MGKFWVILLVAFTCAQVGQGLPLRSVPPAYPHESSPWSALGGSSSMHIWLALALLLTAAGLLFGCAWCYEHKECTSEPGAENQVFTTAVSAHAAPDAANLSPSVTEHNNNGPISLREMQNIANNNATAYISTEHDDNTVSRESIVEFEPLPMEIGVVDPLERYADWFGSEDLPRNRLQYLREICRGWFGRVVEGEMETAGATSAVAVKILDPNASLHDKARFLQEHQLYRDVQHGNVLPLLAQCLGGDPWLLCFELCHMDLQQYLESHRDSAARLTEEGVPLQLMCDVTTGLAHLHARGCLYGNVSTSTVLVRERDGAVQALLGSYSDGTSVQNPNHTASSEVFSLGFVLWTTAGWGVRPGGPPPYPDHLPPPADYSAHLYQVMQLCWEPTPSSRPSSGQVLAMLTHLQGWRGSSGADCTPDFEERWQRLKPNNVPKVDEHVAIVHVSPPQALAALTPDLGSMSRCSSTLSEGPSPSHIRSESLNNLHGSLDDVRNIYLTHNETAAIECHQGNIAYEDNVEDKSISYQGNMSYDDNVEDKSMSYQGHITYEDNAEDKSDSVISVDPWLKDIIADSQDDVSYYKDVSDVIKNLDNILNSEKTSSSESSHQASPSRDNLSLDCKKEMPVQSSLVKSPGISNFQNILEAGFDEEEHVDDDGDRDTIGTLSHSFERRSDTTSQYTLENLTPDTPVKDDFGSPDLFSPDSSVLLPQNPIKVVNEVIENSPHLSNTKIPKDDKCSVSKLPNLRELSVTSLNSVNETDQLKSDETGLCDNYLDEIVQTKSIDNLNQNEFNEEADKEEKAAPLIQNVTEMKHEKDIIKDNKVKGTILPISVVETTNNLVEKEPSRVQDVIKITTLVGSMAATPRVQREIQQISHHDLIPFQQMVSIEPNELITEETPAMITEQISYSEAENITSNKCINIEVEIKEMLGTSPIATPEPVQSLSDDITEITNVSENLFTSSLSEDALIRTESTDKLETSTEPETCPIADKFEEPKVQIDKVKNTNLSFLIDESTQYRDLTEPETCPIANKETKVQMDVVKNTNLCFLSEESTQFLKNLPHTLFYPNLHRLLKETNEFLYSERRISDQIATNITITTVPAADQTADNVCISTVPADDQISCNISTSTPICADSSTKNEQSQENASLEPSFVIEPLSLFESPSKSPGGFTDTCENSSLLGAFESSIEYKGVQDNDVSNEEILAFSPNFNDINLATPSPLLESEFLDEVPDITTDYTQFSYLTSQTMPKRDNKVSDPSATTEKKSPSPPPNSPGIFPASTSQQQYVVDTNIAPSVFDLIPSISASFWRNNNDIDMQINSKLAMAENENNMNLEYSGPLTVEGIVSDEDVILTDNDAAPEAVIAENGGSLEDPRGFLLHEDCVQALRDELELKLPLAQVASIEPARDPSPAPSPLPSPPPLWSLLPPQLVVTYKGLSPIAEETGGQLSAYHSDTMSSSTRADSSESYVEPCDSSTDEVTDLTTGTVDCNATYTFPVQPANTSVQNDAHTSKEISMSPDSLNCSPYRTPIRTQNHPYSLSPFIYRVCNGHDRNSSDCQSDDQVSCEHISQVSPYLISSDTDSVPGDSPTGNPTAISTLSKTNGTTDANHREHSRVTTIESWCSNDTLYNVEENFDDPAPEALPTTHEEEDNSEGTETLHNNEEKDASNCAPIHDSDSDVDTFSSDSITEQHNYTNTKIEAEPTDKITKSETNDTNTQLVDLAYETLPSYSNYTTEVTSSMNDPWIVPQSERMRRSPVNDVGVTPPAVTEHERKFNEMYDLAEIHNPMIITPCVTKMDSVETSCQNDDLVKFSDSVSQNNSGDNGLYKIDSMEIICLQDNSVKYRDSMESCKSGNNTVYDMDIEEITCIQNDTLAQNSKSDNSNYKSGNNTVYDMDIEEITCIQNDTVAQNSKSDNSNYKSGNNTVYDMDIEEITCIQDDTVISKFDNNSGCGMNSFHRHMHSVTSTPLPVPGADDDNVEPIPLILPSTSQNDLKALTSAEQHPLDTPKYFNDTSTNIWSPIDSDLQLEGESMMWNQNRNGDNMITSEHTLNNLDIVGSAVVRPLEAINRVVTQQSEDFRQFENSSRDRPQDIQEPQVSSAIDASALFLTSERGFSEQSAGDVKLMEARSIMSSKNSVNFGQFESSACERPQDLLSAIDSSALVLSTEIGYGEQTSGFVKPLEGSNRMSQHSKDLQFHRSVCDRLQDLSSAVDSSAPLLTSERGFSEQRSGVVKKLGDSSRMSRQCSEDFIEFRRSVCDRPQDMSSAVDASALFLTRETRCSEQTMNDAHTTEAVVKPLDVSPPDDTNLFESQPLEFNIEVFDAVVTDLDAEETDQPHSIIITDVSKDTTFSIASSDDKVDKSEEDNKTGNVSEANETFESLFQELKRVMENSDIDNVETNVSGVHETKESQQSSVESSPDEPTIDNALTAHTMNKKITHEAVDPTAVEQINVSGNTENFATVNFINNSFEDPDDVDDLREGIRGENNSQEKLDTLVSPENGAVCNTTENTEATPKENMNGEVADNIVNKTVDAKTKMAAVTKDFLQNEKHFCQIDSYLPLLNDIRFTGPSSDMMSTSFSQDSPTEPTSPECERDTKHATAECERENIVSDIVKEWDSDTESHSSDSSSGEFIWKDGDGIETAVVPEDYTDHQRSAECRSAGAGGGAGGSGAVSGAGSRDSGSGSEDEVEFVPSSWDSRAEPAKSSLRSLPLTQTPESKKRVVFKRQKYHCVYEYPREATEGGTSVASPGYGPDFSTYCEWDAGSAADAEIGYGQLFGSPSALDLYPLTMQLDPDDCDEDFFVSSSARPFEPLGLMTTSSEFFPGLHSKAHLTRDPSQDIDNLPPPPQSPLPPPTPTTATTAVTTSRTPSLDFTTPDSGVEDITPVSTDDFKAKQEEAWKPADSASASSSESVSPSSPGNEALGGLRHTRDKLKLDLPPSPLIPSPRHNRVFNFVLDKPKRHRHDTDKEKDTATAVASPVVTSGEVITSLQPRDNPQMPSNLDDTEASPLVMSGDVITSLHQSDYPQMTTNLEGTEASPLVTSGDVITSLHQSDYPQMTTNLEDTEASPLVTSGDVITSLHQNVDVITPLHQSEDAPITANLDDTDIATEPTFSTFGKNGQKDGDAENKIVFDEMESEKEVKEESPVKGEGNVLDSGDEDSGIESSSKASLERKRDVS